MFVAAFKMFEYPETIGAFLLTFLCSPALSDPGFDLNIFLNSSDVRGQLSHFWKSTGFCPPEPHKDAGEFDLSSDMKQNLAYIGAVPFNGISQVRVHWLFELVQVIKISEDGPVYDFSQLDEFVSLAHENELYLGFELMGNPSNIYTSMENKTQVNWWRSLVTLTAQRYIALYGLEYVSHWNFESWNEPDCHDFDNLTMTVQGFLNYYDACSEGLKAADKSLIFGFETCLHVSVLQAGKGTIYADSLLNHTIRGVNYFTGERGVRIDFISLHEKGGGVGLNILELETAAVAYINNKYPELRGKPIYDDEADPMVGWNKPLLWRANAVYAGLVVKVISQHQNILKARTDPVIQNYALLSNDNGFLSFYPNQFTQRTLVARFQMNQTHPHYVTFVRKPVYMVMGLLALLGDRQVHVDLSSNSGDVLTNTSDYGAIATVHEPVVRDNTSDSWQMSLLIYGASDPGSNASYADLNLAWYVNPPTSTESLKLMTYYLYNGASNPYDVWAGLFNKTDYPTLKQFAQLRQQEVPYSSLVDVPKTSGFVPIPPRLQVLDPHVYLMHLCSKPSRSPEKVLGVRFVNITQGQVMIVWSDRSIGTKCLLTYEVERSQTSPFGPYYKVSTINSIFTVFIFETESDKVIEGYYRIRAVDYWNRGGDYSDPKLYSTWKS
ncbi:unnamed protein product [Lymnaea stagnalis]|uniref:Alpha-L-iduronidase n=1 Tax=Lymnaea stagnalis TaxID=6523 RepID=A0AAV2HWD0_LYMST